jgi:glycosyl transferase family 92
MVYLSACTLFRDDADYLPEWLEFHLLVGIERFFLYDNESTDDYRDVLAPYVEEGTVVVQHWPHAFPDAIAAAHDHCLKEHGAESRWIAFMDVDEFLFSPTGEALPETLADYESFPGVVASRKNFGTSGHVTRPPGLVIENYLDRMSDDAIESWHAHFVKSIVDPSRTLRASGQHAFVYREGFAVTENREELSEKPWSYVASPTFARLQMNHYKTRSEEELRRKVELWSSTERPLPEGWFERTRDRFKGTRDEAILRYVPDLREALERRQRERAQALPGQSEA